MNIPRLTRLAEILENFESERHNLVQDVDSFDLKYWLHVNSGCTVCAGGMAMLHPEFIAEGLGTISGNNNAGLSPKYDEMVCFDAMARFFELGYSEARYIFDSNAYNLVEWQEPTFVSQRIRAFIAAGEIPAYWGTTGSTSLPM